MTVLDPSSDIDDMTVRHTSAIIAIPFALVALVAVGGCGGAQNDDASDRGDTTAEQRADTDRFATPADTADSFYIQKTPGPGGDSLDFRDTTTDTATFRPLD